MRTASRTWLPALALLLVLTLSVWPALIDAKGEFNLHVAQAGAWLQGRTDVPPGTDVSVYNGKNYVSFPPFPSLLVLPVVAMAGVQATNTVLIALLLSALNIALLVLICREWQVELNVALWASAGFLLGSAYWQAVFQSGGVWNFSHVVSVACGLMAIYIAKRTGLGLLAGMFIGLSFLTRQLTIFLAVFVTMVLWQHPRLVERKSRWTQLALFAGAIAVCVAAYLGYNALRFGNPLQTGYTLMPLSGFLQERFQFHGLWDVRYLPFNLYYLLLAGFEVTFAPPALLRPIGLSTFGTSITIASPFIFSAFLAHRSTPLLNQVSKWQTSPPPTPPQSGRESHSPLPLGGGTSLWEVGGGLRLPSHFLVTAAWSSIALISVPQLFYYNNGWIQYNAQRFTLDFWPALFVLIALGAQYAPRRLWRAAILFAIALNVVNWAFLAKVI